MEVSLDVLLILFRWFENFILFLILMNSLLLALFDYSDRDSKTLYNWYIDLLA